MWLASTQNLWNILVILSRRKPSAVSLSRLVSSSWNLEKDLAQEVLKELGAQRAGALRQRAEHCREDELIPGETKIN